MEHTRAKHGEYCPLPDLAAYKQGVDLAITEALDLRTQLEQHMGGSTQAVSDFGHDINNAIAALAFAHNKATPLKVVNMLLNDYAPRVDSGFEQIRSHVQDAELLQKIDALQERTDGLFGQLRLAQEQHAYPQADQLRQVKILGTVGREGRHGIWL